jgi:tRNA uridine 5-carboxymethylaminomethyl modification enzyme
LMRSPAFNLAGLPDEVRRLSDETIWQHVLIEARYAGYIARQPSRRHPLEQVRIPAHVDFSAIPGLRNETREKLQRTQPETLAVAQRIPGLTDADLSILSLWLHKYF